MAIRTALHERAQDQLLKWVHLVVLMGQCDWISGIVKALCEAIAKNCPKAWVAIISNPVNSTVPIAAEVFKRCTLILCLTPAVGLLSS